MNELAKLTNDVYMPEKALLVYRCKGNNSYYVESFDLDKHGCAINAHPLSLKEGNALSSALDTTCELRQGFLISKGILPENVLFINSTRNGYAMWYTPSMKANLYFKSELTIPDGEAHVPAMLWKASKTKLSVWALAKNSKPKIDAPLFHAPFFNISSSGSVCMGNVEIQINSQTSLEQFMTKWQSYFFNSQFSHMIMDSSPAKNNIVQLWQKLTGTDKPFPTKTLKETTYTLKSLLK